MIAIALDKTHMMIDIAKVRKLTAMIPLTDSANIKQNAQQIHVSE